MKYCGKCGSQMNDEAQFCGNCGEVSNASEIVRNAGNETPLAPDARQVKGKTGAGNKGKILALMVLILALAGGSVWGWSYFSKPNNAALPTSTSEVANKAVGQLDKVPADNGFGNTSGNWNNMGLACQKGEWIYYSTTDGKVYRCHSDGSGQQLLLNDPKLGWIHGINVAGNQVFFERGNNGPLYRMDLDGKNLKMMDGTVMVALSIVYKDWVYFVDYPTSFASSNISRMRTDGSNLQILDELGNGFGYRCIQVKDDWVYFSILGTESLPNKFYRMKLDGSAKSEITDIKNVDFIIVDNWLYTYGQDIFRTNLESKAVEKIGSNQVASGLNYSDGWLYYVKIWDNDAGIFRIRLDGSGQEKIYSGAAMKINIAGDWIYYMGIEDKKEGLYRIRIDGTGKEQLP